MQAKSFKYLLQEHRKFFLHKKKIQVLGESIYLGITYYILDEVLFHCWSKVDLISVWKKVHAMKLLTTYRRGLKVCYVFFVVLYALFH